jgi:hypothetical protein
VNVSVAAPAGPLRNDDGVVAVFLLCLFNLGRYSVQGLVPAYPLPLAFAFLPHSLHGIQNTVRIVNMLKLGKTLGTHRAFGYTCRVAFNVNDSSVFDINQNAAPTMTALTGGSYRFTFVHSNYSFDC